MEVGTWGRAGAWDCGLHGGVHAWKLMGGAGVTPCDMFPTHGAVVRNAALPIVFTRVHACSLTSPKCSVSAETPR